jgi:DNA-binding IclR family transcriptional regulator
MLGLNAVAAPIFDGSDACVGALAMVGSIQFLPERPKPPEVTALKNAARQISRKLGYGRPSEMHSPDRHAANRFAR